MLVAVGGGDAQQGDFIYASDDGETWTNVYESSDYVGDEGFPGLYDVDTDGTNWVAVGNNGIVFSPDGENWTQLNYEVPDVIYHSGFGGVRFGHGRWVAVGIPGVHTSTDGMNWTRQDFDEFQWVNDVEFFYGSSDVFQYVGGHEWKVLATPTRWFMLTTNEGEGIDPQPNLYRTSDLTASGGWEPIFLPVDGWDPENSPDSVSGTYSIELFDGVIWVGGGQGGVWYSEDDGDTWVRVTVIDDFPPFGEFGPEFYGIAYSPTVGEYLMAARAHRYDSTLPKTEWDRVEFDGDLRDVVWDPTLEFYVFVGGPPEFDGAPEIRTSSTGASLSVNRFTDGPNPDFIFHAVACSQPLTLGASVYVAVGTDKEALGDGFLYVSTDSGRNWDLVLELYDDGNSKRLWDVANDGLGNWIAAGDEGIYRSPDGLIWDGPHLVDGTAYMTAVHYAHGVWMVGGNIGNLYTSPDGETWTSVGEAFPAYNTSVWIHTISAFDAGWYVGTDMTTGAVDGDYSGWYANSLDAMSIWQGFLFTNYGPDFTDGDLSTVHQIVTTDPENELGADVAYTANFNGVFSGLGDGVIRVDDINDFDDTDPGTGDFTDRHVYGAAYSPTRERWVFTAGGRSYYLDGTLGTPETVGEGTETQDEIRGAVWSPCDSQFVYVGMGDPFT